MTLHSLIAASALLALSACVPAAQYTEAEAPKNLTLDNASSHVTVRFAPGSSQLVARDAARLRTMAANGRIAPSDRVTVAAAGSPALAAARFSTVAATLAPYRVLASSTRIATVPANHALVHAERYLVTLPTCPNWSKSAAGAGDYSNTEPSNFGCATAVNLGMMVATPADLIQGRPVGLVEAQPAAAAANRYLNDKVQLPAAATVGPITAPSSAPPAAPGGGATGSGG